MGDEKHVVTHDILYEAFLELFRETTVIREIESRGKPLYKVSWNEFNLLKNPPSYHEMYAWCEESFGEENDDVWYNIDRTYYFANKEELTLFLVRWG